MNLEQAIYHVSEHHLRTPIEKQIREHPGVLYYEMDVSDGCGQAWLACNVRYTTAMEDFAMRMEQIFQSDDLEGSHQEADKLMCEILISLGYGKGVEIFQKADKWYA